MKSLHHFQASLTDKAHGLFTRFTIEHIVKNQLLVLVVGTEEAGASAQFYAGMKSESFRYLFTMVDGPYFIHPK